MKSTIVKVEPKIPKGSIVNFTIEEIVSKINCIGIVISHNPTTVYIISSDIEQCTYQGLIYSISNEALELKKSPSVLTYSLFAIPIYYNGTSTSTIIGTSIYFWPAGHDAILVGVSDVGLDDAYCIQPLGTIIKNSDMMALNFRTFEHHIQLEN